MAQNKRPSTSIWSPIQKIRRFFGGTEAKPENPDRAAYLEDLIYQHRHFDVKGISAPGESTLDLARVFVDVGLGPTPGSASANPIPSLQKSAREERHSIWRFLLPHPARPLHNIVVLAQVINQ